eukprot:PITA_18778
MEVWQVVEESRTLRWMFPGMNATFIALVSKVDQPSTPHKYRPIALCNIIYKIVSKIIASRLKLLLPLIISPEQFGYVEGRQITDGIILTHEIIHTLKHSKKPCMLLKIDLSKAFDSLSWMYIKKILITFGFAPPWQFVDDNILFEHPYVQEARQLKSLLTDFSEASGASINKSKSQIFFFHTPAITQATIACILGFSIADLPSKYLGVPLTTSALNHSSWKILLEKLEAFLSSWTHRSLNMASRVVLIKSVLHSMSVYLFSIIAAPKWVLKEIKHLQRSFLWGSSGLKHKWALVKWDTTCLPKSSGGTGLRDPSHNNEVMGSRIWWKWLTAPLTPWASL